MVPMPTRRLRSATFAAKRAKRYEMNAILRALGPSDLPAVAAIHRAAFPSSWLTKLGNAAVVRYYAWQMEGPHEAYVFGVTTDGKLGGFCFCGVFPTAIAGYVRQNWALLAWRLLIHPSLLRSPLLAERLQRAFHAFFQREAKARPATGERGKRPFDILSIAVDPAVQRMGLGRLMMERARALAGENGFHVMTLMVNPENQQAVRFYEKIGWERALMNGEWRGNMVQWVDRRITQVPS
jgi:ribosomal protein S18 acetylase RimI-like enzyme